MNTHERSNNRAIVDIYECQKRAKVLLEALPYIRRLKQAIIVIKCGGAELIDETLKSDIMDDLVLLNLLGPKLIVVHGGNQEISALMKRIGKKPQILEGRRVTDSDTMAVTEMVLSASVNKEIVAALNTRGIKSVGISGRDANLLIGRKYIDESKLGVDYGRVGVIERVDTTIIKNLIQCGYIPVVSPVSNDIHGFSLNINADDVATAIAQALKADRLMLLSNVPGILDNPSDPKTLLSIVKTNQIDSLISQGKIKGGMLPKIKALGEAVQNGVKKVHLIDGSVPHSLIMEIFTDKGIGTLIEKDEEEKVCN